MAWGGLFISVMGVWRCLRDDKLNYCPALFICNGLNTVSGVLTVKENYEKEITFQCYFHACGCRRVLRRTGRDRECGDTGYAVGTGA